MSDIDTLRATAGRAIALGGPDAFIGLDLSAYRLTEVCDEVAALRARVMSEDEAWKQAMRDAGMTGDREYLGRFLKELNAALGTTSAEVALAEIGKLRARVAELEAAFAKQGLRLAEEEAAHRFWNTRWADTHAALREHGIEVPE